MCSALQNTQLLQPTAVLCSQSPWDTGGTCWSSSLSASDLGPLQQEFCRPLAWVEELCTAWFSCTLHSPIPVEMHGDAINKQLLNVESASNYPLLKIFQRKWYRCCCVVFFKGTVFSFLLNARKLRDLAVSSLKLLPNLMSREVILPFKRDFCMKKTKVEFLPQVQNKTTV